ncbi:MAG: hypothetical protein AAF460_14885 [Pseudomonadota bacterium]
MKHTLILTCLLSAVFGAHAGDPTDMTFEEGYALVLCRAPGDREPVSSALFRAGFPHWMTFLQRRADEGVVVRAHYLGELREGVFVVVQGSSREHARSNASALVAGMDAITAAAISESGSSLKVAREAACRVLDIGPLAILPR